MSWETFVIIAAILAAVHHSFGIVDKLCSFGRLAFDSLKKIAFSPTKNVSKLTNKKNNKLAYDFPPGNNYDSTPAYPFWQEGLLRLTSAQSKKSNSLRTA